MGRLTTFRGVPVVPGEATGVALVADNPLSFWGGLDPGTGMVIDRHHPLFGRRLTGRVLAVPGGRGSCSASGILLEAIRAGTGPAGIILSRPDPIIALGAILGDELYGLVVPVVLLPESERSRIGDGDRVRVTRDGSVQIEPRQHASLGSS